MEDHLYASVNSDSRSMCVLKVECCIDRLCRASYFKRRNQSWSLSVVDFRLSDLGSI